MSSTVNPSRGPSLYPPDDLSRHGAALWAFVGVSLLYLCVLFAASHWPHESLPWRDLAIRYDKPIHTTSFALLTVLLTCSIKAIGYLSRRDWLAGIFCRPLVVFVLLGSYALFDEVTQKLAGRKFDWHDWAADLVGIGIGLVLLSLAKQLRRRRSGTFGAPSV